MSRVLIVTGSRTASGANALFEAAQKYHLSPSGVIIGKDDIKTAIEKAHTVFYRIGAKSYDFYNRLQPILSSPQKEVLGHVLDAFDKSATFDQLRLHDISTPASYLLARDDQPAEYPVVVKILHGNQGKGIELLFGEDDYDYFKSRYSEEPIFLAQEYIEEAGASDKRLIIANGRLIAAMRRMSSGSDFRANLHAGGTAESYSPTTEEVTLATRSIDAMGLVYGGVDIIDSKGGPLVLEVNPSPGFGISQITGVNVAEEVIKAIFAGELE